MGIQAKVIVERGPLFEVCARFCVESPIYQFDNAEKVCDVIGWEYNEATGFAPGPAITGALWKRTLVEKNRVREAPDLMRILVGVDQEATSEAES
jgi:hypothetical protein